ncbi:MAG TPA: shikimate kinase [Mycobacteriales bacterium]|nr:shikimate kinase [Mycobacteriales bacterium]
MSTVDRVLLVGMMGAGKTTVGRELGIRLGWPYLDNDELLERAVGKETRRVQEEDGEAALRRAESVALTMALTAAGPLVASVAGGVVTKPLDCDRLRSGGYVVWLRGSIRTLAERVEGTDRPWVGEDPDRVLTELYAGRAHLYESVASLIVDVDELPAERLADLISSHVSRC